jgi:hypothetical protein
MIRRIGLLVVAVFLAATAIETVETARITGTPGIALPAEAIVGRPLTPVSYAGVARRTVRRCAVGVYYC